MPTKIPARRTSLIQPLPDTPGVYLFYGTAGELLYIGKSRNIRTRVRGHFASRDEAWLSRRIRKIDYRETAGELGALLLESRLIKELRPLYNIAARRRRHLIVARRVALRGGYAGIHLEEVEYLSPSETKPILAIFKHRKQAMEYLAGIAKSHRLCPKLLRMEAGRGYCFGYHLAHCNGACMGEEEPAAYNSRFEEAFMERRIHAWPFNGSIDVEERRDGGSIREVFTIDNWCLLSSRRFCGGEVEEHVSDGRRFDYDTYKILYSHVMSGKGQSRSSRRCGPKIG